MILHLDMDAFFASVEQLDNPELRGRPLVIGGRDRGVVSTASYEARKYGIHSAMPVATAKKLCPHAIFMQGNYKRYSEISRIIMGRLADLSPQIQPASIDEAYLQVPENINLENYAKLIKNEVYSISGGLTCSAGLANAKFLAKICSDYKKPDGLFVLYPEQVEEFLTSLDVSKIPGVGKRMRASLGAFGVHTVAQLRSLGQEFLELRYGKFGSILYERALGIDKRTVHPNPPPKSEGCERTFETNVKDRKILEEFLVREAAKIAERLQRQKLKGRTITLKIKFANFQQITRCRTLLFRTDTATEIAESASQILAKTHLPQPVRLIGICVSGFAHRPEQLLLPGMEKIGSGFNKFDRSER